MAFKLYGYQFAPAKRYLKASKLYFSDNGILTGLKLKLSCGQWVKNFVISELEKRRKLGFIKTDQFYYYKSSGGAEIDLLFEEGTELFAIEIKAKEKIAQKDLTNLKDFVGRQKKKKKTKPVLFYLGNEYKKIAGISCIPIYAIWRGH